ncbi:MAG: hypothetical protein PUE07_03255, partial [bacterium]|nr:hypothetical protein [bacterium]
GEATIALSQLSKTSRSWGKDDYSIGRREVRTFTESYPNPSASPKHYIAAWALDYEWMAIHS